jgi:hypothetical protein
MDPIRPDIGQAVASGWVSAGIDRSVMHVVDPIEPRVAAMTIAAA